MVLTVVGNRPQFVKAAAVSRHLRELVDETLVHSGQHYDRELSEVFFEELALAPPDRNLGVGSGSHAQQTAATMVGLEPLIVAESPAAVLVYGDTNTTLAGALVASKLGVPVVHVEAGMRSFDRAMPEEVNRVAVDLLADLLLCPTAEAIANLEAAGLAGRARLIGDVMADVALELGPIAERRSRALDRFGLRPGGFLLATLHRAGNVDDPAALGRAVDLLVAVAERHGPVVTPLHPRTRARLAGGDLLSRLEGAPGMTVVEPLGYLDFACLTRTAGAVLTDSGGVQKEAYLAGVPCLTLREQTEWVETLDEGRNRLVGLDADLALRILDDLDGESLEPPDSSAYGGGGAGLRCAQEVAALVGAT
jgi:UDP-N-acetylglucosamine 2-epimerase (non-hydrolysing)/UDP-GlcNAc3NAcA epimerase